jgi:hypothetical protein
MDLLSNPLVWKVLVAYWVFSAAVGAMPTPDANGSKGYIFLFRFAHGISGNLNRAAVVLHVPSADDKADAAKQG